MSLNDLILARIATDGPLRVDEYMALCLTHPSLGYYTTRDPLGQAGDFTTAPEISQMFGELVGLWLAQTWLDRGAPEGILVELGPGRGTLMADILRVTRAVPDLHARLSVHLVEVSGPLRARQRATLEGQSITWVDRVEDLPDAPLFLVANEFFDALPIRQFQATDAGWAERLIGAEGARLSFGLAPASQSAPLTRRFGPQSPGTVVESCAAAEAVTAQIAARLIGQGGAALIIDYGAWQGTGETLQALCDHSFVDPLSNPGQADLTAHVQFAPLAPQPLTRGFATQGAFLAALGVRERAAQLAPRDPGAPGAAQRLTAPDQMGDLFKVLGLAAPRTPALPGLEPVT
ncbi:MAG: SAM-dependent methyltransferase [Pseudomonadota bacterium]